MGGPQMFFLLTPLPSNVGYFDFSLLKNTIYEIEQKVTIDWNVDNNRYEQWVLSQRQ